MKRAAVIGAIGAVVALAVSGALYGPELVSGYRFMNALDQYYAGYEANGGDWPQFQDSCTSCHGVNGQPRSAQYAALAGQTAAYIEAQLHAFADGRRRSPQMAPLAADLNEEQIKSLAAYFARQRPETTEMPSADATLAQRGQVTVAARACSACHGEKLSGGPLGPRLAGQGELYLQDQLRDFKQGRRQDPSGAMNAMASSLADDEIEATAHYLASLKPAEAPGTQ